MQIFIFIYLLISYSIQTYVSTILSYLSVNQFLHLSTYLYIYVSFLVTVIFEIFSRIIYIIYVCIYLSISQSMYLSVLNSMYLFIYPTRLTWGFETWMQRKMPDSQTKPTINHTLPRLLILDRQMDRLQIDGV